MKPRGPMSRQIVKLVAAFVAGGVVGAAALSLLSTRASKLYVQTLRLSFASEEERRLADAWRRGDYVSAARHAACGIEAESESASFNPSNSVWDWTYPVVGLWVNERTSYPVDSRDSLRALAHSRMGRVLEKQGKSDEAAKEYAEAARLGGGDANRWRAAASVTLRDKGSSSPR